jgi:hypothetical protein
MEAQAYTHGWHRTSRLAPNDGTVGCRRLVVSQLAKDQKWPPGKWAFDGRKNIYTPTAFLPKEERSYQVMNRSAQQCRG